MLSGDDNFDFDDEEFVKVALDLEATSQETPGKRKSFELGTGVRELKSTLPRVSNFNGGQSGCGSQVGFSVGGHRGSDPEFLGPPMKRRSFDNPPFPPKTSPAVPKPGLGAMYIYDSNIGNKARVSEVQCSTVTHVHANNQPRTKLPAVLGQISSDKIQTASGKGISSHLTEQCRIPDFDLDDIDLDLSLDEPSTWTPAVQDAKINSASFQNTNRDLNKPKAGVCKDDVIFQNREPSTDHRALQNIAFPLNESNKDVPSSRQEAHDAMNSGCIEMGTASASSVKQRIVLPEGNRETHPRFPEFLKPGPTEPLRKQFETPSPGIKAGSGGSEWPGSSDSRVSVKSGKKRKRKFPGPAGLLPKLKPGMSFDDVKLDSPSPTTSNVKKPDEAEPEMLCSQSSEDLFSDAPWQRMKKELDKRAHPIIEGFNLAAVLRKASLRQLPRGKVPVTCVLIDQLGMHMADASAILRDPSGQMKGTIHRQLMKEYASQIGPGTVLVLRQVGVFSPSARNHYLNITPSNLSCLYYKDTSGSVAKLLVSQLVAEDFIVPTVSQINRSLSDCRMEQRPQSPTTAPTLRPLIPNRGPPQNVNTQRSVTPRGLAPSSAGPRRGLYQTTPLQAGPYSSNIRSQQPQQRPPPSRSQNFQRPYGSNNVNIPHPPQYVSNSSNMQQNSRDKSECIQSHGFPLRASANSAAVTGRGINPGLKQGGSVAVAGTTPTVVPQKSLLPRSGASAIPQPDRQDNSDLWGDDHLDDLLIGIEDEMLEDF